MASMPPVYDRTPKDLWAEFRLGTAAPLPGAAVQGGPATESVGYPLRLADEVEKIFAETLDRLRQRSADGGDGRGANPGGVPAGSGTQMSAPVSSGTGSGGSPADRGSLQPNDPKMFGSLPVGTQIQWDFDTPDRAWDRNKVLFDKTGFTSDGEAQYVAFLNANIGRGLTAQQIRDWLESKGLGSARPNADGDAEQMMEKDLVEGRAKFGNYDFSAEQKAYEDNLKRILAVTQQVTGRDPNTIIGAGKIGATQGVTLAGGDELQGAGGFLTALLTGNDPVQGYRLARDLARMENEQAHDAHPYVYNTTEFLGSLAVPVPGLAEAKTVGGVARATAGAAGLYGFNAGEGIGDSIYGATNGIAIGGATGPVLHSAINAFADPLTKLITKAAGKNRLPEAGERIAIGKALDVPVSNAEVYVRANKQGLRERKFDDAKPVFERSDAAEDQAIQNSLRTHVGGPGQAVDDHALGNTLRGALDGLPLAGKAALPDLFDAAGRPVGVAQIAGTVRGWAQTDPAKLKLVLDALPPAAQEELRASLFNNLGVDASGKFSLKQFLTSVVGDADTAPQIEREAQRLILGRDRMRALGGLRVLVEGKLATRGDGKGVPTAFERGMRALPKGMRTTFMSVFGSWLGKQVGGDAGLLLGGLTGLGDVVLQAVGEQRVARLVTSPVFMKWAERMPEATDPRAIERYFEVLTKKAATNAVLQQDVEVLRQAMMGTLVQPAPSASDQPQQ